MEWLRSVQESLEEVGPYKGPEDMQVLREIWTEMEEAGAMPKEESGKTQKAAGKESKASGGTDDSVSAHFLAILLLRSTSPECAFSFRPSLSELLRFASFRPLVSALLCFDLP